MSAPDQLTAYMTARVTFLEQLAQALPIQVLLANFSGDAAWSRYEKVYSKCLQRQVLHAQPLRGVRNPICPHCSQA